jgi:hypothetical protein
VTAILAAGEANVPSGEVFHLAGPGTFTWEQVGHALGEVLGVRPKRVRISVPMLLALATVADAWGWVTGRRGISRGGKYGRLRGTGSTTPARHDSSLASTPGWG